MSMFRAVAAFELRYQLKSPVFWVTGLIFALMTFGAVASDNIQIGSGGNVLRNSPYAIAQTCMIMAVFGIFIMTAFVANVVVRDDETAFGPIIHSTRISRFDYLFGRFTGAFIAGCLAFLSVPIGMMLGAAMPWVDPETIGPFRLGDYAYVYFALCVPTLFVTGAGFFALATATRSMLATYVGVIVFLVIYLVASTYFAKPEFAAAAALADPFGLAAVDLVTKYWTASERNARLPPLVGSVLQNRAIWFGVAFGLLTLAWLAFRRAKRMSRRERKRAAAAAAAQATADAPWAVSGTGSASPRPVGALSATAKGGGWAKLVALTRFDMRAAFRSPGYVVLLGIGFVNAIGGLWDADDFYGTQVHPVTRLMIETLEGSFTIIPLIIAIYYAGELVWRDRERRVHEIVDATPSPDWAFVLPKILAISLVLLTTILASVAAAICVQAFKGHLQFELGHYLGWYVAPWLVDVVLYAVLAVFIQTLVPHKFVGLLVMLVFLVAQMTLARIGFEHNLYQYAGAPNVPLSDMNGQGDFARHAAWFRAYWSAGAVILAVLAYGLWRRGVSAPLSARLQRLPRRLAGPAGALAAVAALVMAGLGGYIWYNTNVLNDYRTRNDNERWAADYEKTLFDFERVPQPRIADVTLDVAVYPHEPRIVTKGRYTVENRTDAPLEQVHVQWSQLLDLKNLEVDGASLSREFKELHYRIYKLDTPMAPGQRREMRFETVREQVGFRNSGNEQRIVDNGTFVDSTEIALGIGFSRGPLLQDRAKRRKYGLPAERRPAKLEDERARAFQYVGHDSDWVNADITASTVEDQVVIAPGYLVDTKVVDGRRISHYRTDAPILGFFSIQSAKYAVREDRWNDVALAVYYDPVHAYNVDRMLAGMKASLDYCTTNFSPFQFRQIRILEFPAYEDFAQSFANTIPYSEGIGFIVDTSDPEKIDMVTYVTAHEVAHQWWAHQVIGADMQGMTLLSESLAQYSAIMIMEKMYGPDQIRKFLKFELDRYLRSRGGEVIEELPLDRVENQPYIHYRKGSLAMYLLKDQIGEAAVNRALQSCCASMHSRARRILARPT
jgi:ABC-type transport system involved in multi-copper enzyme maturation permease subunit